MVNLFTHYQEEGEDVSLLQDGNVGSIRNCSVWWHEIVSSCTVVYIG